MALRDEIKREQESLKTKPLKEKIQYIADYYKWQIIGVLVAVVCVCCFIYSGVTAKDELLRGVLLNVKLYNFDASQEDYLKISDDFLTQQNLSGEKYKLALNTSITLTGGEDAETQYYQYQNQSVLTTQYAAGALDFITGDLNTIIDLAYVEYVIDLSEILSEEEYAAYEPYFLYIDKAVVDEINQSIENMESSFQIDYPDCTNPNAMEEPIPVLIDMSQSEIVQTIYNYPANDTIVFGIFSNVQNEEYTVEFMNYLLFPKNE